MMMKSIGFDSVQLWDLGSDFWVWFLLCCSVDSGEKLTIGLYKSTYGTRFWIALSKLNAWEEIKDLIFNVRCNNI